MTESEDENLCIGVCEADPEGNYCTGCGRPLVPTGAVNQVIDSGIAPPEPAPVVGTKTD